MSIMVSTDASLYHESMMYSPWIPATNAMLSVTRPKLRYCLATHVRLSSSHMSIPGRSSHQILMSISPRIGRVMRGLSSRPMNQS